MDGVRGKIGICISGFPYRRGGLVSFPGHSTHAHAALPLLPLVCFLWRGRSTVASCLSRAPWITKGTPPLLRTVTGTKPALSSFEHSTWSTSSSLSCYSSQCRAYQLSDHRQNQSYLSVGLGIDRTYRSLCSPLPATPSKTNS